MDSLRMGTTATWLVERAQLFTADSNSTTLYGAATNSTTQQAFIAELRFAAAKSIRTSTIILAAFNAVAAFATACGILYDAFSTRRQNRLRYRPRTPSSPQSSFIRSAEVYPLIISFGITIQGISFAIAQSRGLASLLIMGCTIVSQFVFPAVFIVPYIQLVFSLEFAIRGLRKKPFPPRGKHSITVCLVIVGLLLLINFLVAIFVRSPNFCFASLFWFVAMYSRGSFAVFLAIDIILVACIIIISVRLSGSILIETAERVAASRMVYYLALAILSNALIMPFFFSIGFGYQKSSGDQNGSTALTLSMVASVVANVSGLMTGGLHLFLRSSSMSTIGPRDKAGEYERRRIKEQIRRYDGNPDSDGHMMGPVSSPDNSSGNSHRMLSDASLISDAYNHKDEEAGMTESNGFSTYEGSPRRGNSQRSNITPTTSAETAAAIRTPEPAQMLSVTMVQQTSTERPIISAKKVPALPESPKPLLLLPATTYTPGSVKTATTTNNGRFDRISLKPPPSMNNLIGGRHRRDSSVVSSATVQIGLRLSNVEDLPPINRQMPDQKVYTLEFAPSDELPPAVVNNTEFPPQPSPLVVRRPSPLAYDSVAAPSESDDDSSTEDASSRRHPERGARMKTLPPVPRPLGDKGYRANGSNDDDDDDDDIFGDGNAITPSVYSPATPNKTMATRLPSPSGVGFANVPSRNNSTNARPFVTAASVSAESNKSPGDWI